MDNIYADIAARTGGNIYIGVVGPVRTGKSTLIKRIMETLVIPNISDPYRQERARDELPQCGSGKTIMTAEPKFVPEEAVEICPEGDARLSVRMIDSVGYIIPGAIGAEEDGVPRMVSTPWFDQPIPMTQAAELGTKKVMEDHCSIGILVTTDGTITDIPRADYLEAERRCVADMKATGKPFLVIINSREPEGAQAAQVRDHLRQELGVDAAIADCQALQSQDIATLLGELLGAFPVTQVRISLPRWMDCLEADHPVKSTICKELLERCGRITAISQAVSVLSGIQTLDCVDSVSGASVDLGTGVVSIKIVLPEKLFYETLSQRSGMEITSDAQLLTLLTSLTQAKQEYDKISDALQSVNATGYGVVMPRPEQLRLEKPEVLKKGTAYGVKLKALAPSIHMMRIDLDAQISPMVGDEQQSRELVDSLAGEDPDQLWQSNIFGKSVYDLLQEGLSAKVLRLSEDVREKFRGSLGRIVNEGATGLICLIL